MIGEFLADSPLGHLRPSLVRVDGGLSRGTTVTSTRSNFQLGNENSVGIIAKNADGGNVCGTECAALAGFPKPAQATYSATLSFDFRFRNPFDVSVL